MSLKIETDRLILRPLRADDVDDLLEYQSRAEIVRYIPWPERTREQVIEALDKAISDCKYSLLESGDFILLAWELKSTGKVIGQSNSGLESTRDQLADIGLSLIHI